MNPPGFAVEPPETPEDAVTAAVSVSAATAAEAVAAATAAAVSGTDVAPDAERPHNNNDDDSSTSRQGEDDDDNNNDNDLREQQQHQNVAAPYIRDSLEEAPQGTEGRPSNPSLALDWTQLGVGAANTADAVLERIRYPHDVVELDPNDEDDDELVVVGTAGQKITHMGADLSSRLNPKLRKLILRSHLIRTMEGLQNLHHLELLELYDNQVQALQGLEPPKGVGATLKVLDMSFNAIRDMTPVQFCPNLTELYLANNKLKVMAGLTGLSQLIKLDLGANRIRIMDPEQLSHLNSLQELWLGKNKIELIQGLDQLINLRRLDVQSNRLVSVDNLTAQVETLEELYLAHNGITTEGVQQPTGLALHFTQLSVLDLSRNQLDDTTPLAHLQCLEELWLSSNQIATMEQVEPLSHLTHLETIYLEHNPVQGSDPLYRKNLKLLLASLTQIDATPVVTVGVGSTNYAAASTLSQHRPAETDEDRVRRLQEAVVQRAKAETQRRQILEAEEEQQQQQQQRPPPGTR